MPEGAAFILPRPGGSWALLAFLGPCHFLAECHTLWLALSRLGLSFALLVVGATWSAVPPQGLASSARPRIIRSRLCRKRCPELSVYRAQ